VGRGQDRCREHGSSPIDRTTSERVGEQEWSVLRRGQDCLHPLHEEQHPSARGRTDNRQMGGDTAHTHRQDPRYGYGHTTALPRTRCTCCDDRATGGHGAEGTARALAVSPECAIICTRCQYALQPAGEAVSKHLWEKHEVPLNQRVGLNSFVRSLHLPDPNVLLSRPDGSAPHPHVLTQPGFRCVHCRYTTTSRNLLQRHIGTSHQIGVSRDHRSEDHGNQRIRLQY
jgi:hypothetical protein